MSMMTAEKPTTITKTKPPGNPDFWVKVGESFQIKLTENPSTGYLWALARLPESFYLLSDSFMAPDKPGMVGVPGTHVYNFVAMKPKIQGDFVFYLLRPSEPLVPTEESDWCVRVN